MTAETEILLPTPEEIEKTTNLYIDDRMSMIVGSQKLYGLMLMRVDLKVVGPDFCPYAAISIGTLYLNGVGSARNPEGIKAYWELPRETRLVILAHEVLHLGLCHLEIPPGLQKEIANIAQDAVINRILYTDPSVSFSAMPEGVVIPTQGMSGFTIGSVEGKRQKFDIVEYENTDWYGIYEQLMQTIEKNSGKSKQQAIKEFLDSIRDSMAGDTSQNAKDPNEMTPEETQKQFKFVQSFIDACQTSKSQGDLPKGLDRLIHNLTESVVDWREVFSEVIRKVTTYDDFDWRGNSRRAHIGHFPKIKSESFGDVVFIVDTSGSISDEELNQAMSEIIAARATNMFKLHVACCDSQCYEFTTFDRWERPDISKISIKGFGGTSFIPAFEAVNTMIEKGQIENMSFLVYITDGYGTFPSDPPEYPVIWLYSKNADRNDPPFGTVIRVNHPRLKPGA